MFNFKKLTIDKGNHQGILCPYYLSKEFAMKYIYAALADIAFSTPIFAQSITAEAGLSTLGLYAAPIYEMNEILISAYHSISDRKTISRQKVTRQLMGKSHLNPRASCLIITPLAVDFASAVG